MSLNLFLIHQNELIDVVKRTVDLFVNQPNLFTQQTNRYTGNTKKLGFYMVYNKKTKKFYLGSFQEFSLCLKTYILRVAYFQRDFQNYFSGKQSRLYQSFINDITTSNCTKDDFFFVPLITFDKNSTEFINLENLQSRIRL